MCKQDCLSATSLVELGLLSHRSSSWRAVSPMRWASRRSIAVPSAASGLTSESLQVANCFGLYSRLAASSLAVHLRATTVVHQPRPPSDWGSEPTCCLGGLSDPSRCSPCLSRDKSD